jgi:hypothetical protein
MRQLFLPGGIIAANLFVFFHFVLLLLHIFFPNTEIKPATLPA